MTEIAPKGLPGPVASFANRDGSALNKGFYWLPCLALVLQGCGKSPTNEWIVGSWIPANLSCDSGGGDVYERTGQWRTEGQEGTWKLDGSELTINVTGTYDDSYELKPSNDVYTLHIAEFDENAFTTSATGNTPDIKWKRCSFDLDQTPPATEGQPAAPETTAPPGPAAAGGSLIGPSEQKIIWEWTGGFRFMQTSVENSAVVQRECAQMNESLNQYTANGWEIKSSTPAERAVSRGVCQGRDIIIEK